MVENIFVTSDLHLSHLNIIKYCERPYEFSDEGVKQMNEALLSKFDELPRGSTIINNGDIFLSSKISFYQMKRMVDRMKRNNKKLILVLGNHDRKTPTYIKAKWRDPVDYFKALGFDEVQKYPILLEGEYLFSHEPVYLNPGSNLKNIYGHTHNYDVDENYFNRECENFATMEVAKKEGTTKQKNLDVDTSVKPLGKLIDTDNYVNVCWDKNKRIIPLSEILKS